MRKFDLHIHSNHSGDGEWTVQQILASAKSLGLSTLAITDHNTVKGIEEALQYGRQLQVEVIPGIEIDCNCLLNIEPLKASMANKENR